jgi:hypothetical protein
VKMLKTLLVKSVLITWPLLLSPLTNAQITLPGGTVIGGDIGLKVCKVQACFANEAAKAQYERESNCKFVNKNLCGDKPIDEAKQCCGNDAKNGTVKIKDRVNTQLDPKFSWQTYRQECQNLRQSEGRPDALWRQCVVGQRHAADDAYPVVIVESNGAARPYCIDGCSTPPRVVKALYKANIFLFENKDNPTGFLTSSFFNACGTHDKCYQTCNGNDQRFCDNELLNNMLAACATIPADDETAIVTFGVSYNVNTRDKCISAASNMHTGLSTPIVGGVNAFNRRRQQYCQCC